MIQSLIFLAANLQDIFWILGYLLYVPMGGNKSLRLGGSALAQCFRQLGKVAPLIDDPELFTRAFNTTQDLIQGKANYQV